MQAKHTLEEDFFNIDYGNRLIQILEQVITHAFPDIENLEIKKGKGTNLKITLFYMLKLYKYNDYFTINASIYKKYFYYYPTYVIL